MDLSQIYVMPLWLFNIYMDGVVTAEGNGVNVVGVDGRRW